MLDLKAKLAAAGLVSQKEVEQAEARQAKAKARAKARSKTGSKAGSKAGSGSKGRGKGPKPKSPRLDLAKQRAALDPKNRGECYLVTRRWVEKSRLDTGAQLPSEDSSAFHFSSKTGKVGRLYIEPNVREQLKSGNAAITAYMSNHGLAHAVVPKAVALEIFTLFPLWLRVLAGHDGAGQLETPESSEQPAPQAQATN